jgi:hypothetical protein
VNAKNASGRCSGFVVVTVTGVLWLDSFREVESVTSCARRSYDDMLKEERVIELLRDGYNEPVVADHHQAAYNGWWSA